MLIPTTCPFCGETHYIPVKSEDWYAYVNEEKLVQEAFSYLSADEREMLKTGICPTCWEKMFGGE